MDPDEDGPALSGFPIFFVPFATSWTGWDNLLAGTALVGGLILAVVAANAEASLGRLPRSRLLARIDREEKRNKLEAILKDPEEITAQASLLKLIGISGLIFGLLYLTEPTLPRVIWAIVTGLIALIFLEILPLSMARRNPEALALRTLPILLVTRGPLLPLIRPFLAARVILLRALGFPSELKGHEELAGEIMAAVEEQERAEPLAKDEREWIENIVDLKEITASAVMIPRTDMVGLEKETPITGVLALAIKEGHSRLPVYEEHMDQIIGIFYVKDILPHVAAPEGKLNELRLKDLIRKPFFVPETKKVRDLLREFRSLRLHMAIVLDEYGGTSGLVTIEDILEEIVGEIEDEYDNGEALPIKIIEQGKIAEMEAKTHVREVNETMETDFPEDEDFETIGGFVCSILGRIPTQGETFDHDGARFKILKAQERSVDLLRIEILKPAPGEAKNGKLLEG